MDLVVEILDYYLNPSFPFIDNMGLVIWSGAGHMVQHTRADEIVAIVARLADGETLIKGRFVDTYGIVS